MSRVYEIDGKQYYSVTTIIGILEKPALVGWAAKMTASAFAESLIALPTCFDGGYRDLTADKIRELEADAKKNYRKQSETAMSYGTTVHEMIESYCKDGVAPWLDDKPVEVQTAWAAWMEWVEQHDYEPLHQEVEIVNVEHGYAGRFDAIANVNGIPTLLDFKTSTGCYDEMLYQLAAYWMGNASDGSELPDIQQAGILRLDKVTGLPEWKVYTMDDLTYGWEVFRHLAKVYRLIKGEAKPAKSRKEKSNGFNN